MNQFSDINLSFENSLSPFLLAFMFFSYISLFLYTSKGIKARLEKWSYIVLLISQLFLILVYLFIMCEPSIKKTYEKKVNGTLLTAFDISKSTILRNDNPWSLIYKKNNLIEDNAKDFKKRYFYFSEHSEEISTHKISTPKLSHGTDIFSSLNEIYNTTDKDDENIFLIFTDGQDKGLIKKIDQIKSWGIPIYSVGIGTSENNHLFRDIAIESLKSPEVIPINSSVRLKVFIKSIGNDDKNIKINIFDNNDKVSSSIIKVIKGVNSYSKVINWEPKKTGRHQIKISLVPIEGEKDRSNNNIVKYVDVIEKNKNILFINGELNWEGTFISRQLERSGFKLFSLNIASKDKIISSSDRNLDIIPDISDLKNYSLIILKNLPFNFLPDKHQQRIELFIRDYGGGLIIIPGNKTSFSLKTISEKIRNILPFRVDEFSIKKDSIIENASLINKRKSEQYFNLFSENIRNKIYPVISYYKTGDIKPNSEILMETNNSHKPLVSSVKFGLGKVLFISLDNSYLWHLSTETTEKDFHRSFWINTCSFAAGLNKLNDNSFKLKLNDEIYYIKTPVSFRTVFSTDKNDLTDISPEISVISPTGKTFKINNQKFLNNKIGFQSTFIPDIEGKYVISASLKTENSNLNDSATIYVRKDNSEYENLTVNKHLLTKLSQSTGGDFKTFSQYIETPFNFKRQIKTVRKKILSPIWNNPLFLLFTVFIFSIPWFIKRNANLE